MLTKFLVLHSYKPKKKGELTLEIGDKIIITGKENKSMCEGKIVDSEQSGKIPRSFLEQLKEGIETDPEILSKILYQGSLFKKKEGKDSYAKFFCKIFPRSLALFKNKKQPEPLVVILLQEIVSIEKVKQMKKKKNSNFILKSETKSWHFRCKTEKEAKVWIEKILPQAQKVSSECKLIEQDEKENEKNKKSVKGNQKKNLKPLSRAKSDHMSFNNKSPGKIKRSFSLRKMGNSKVKSKLKSRSLVDVSVNKEEKMMKKSSFFSRTKSKKKKKNKKKNKKNKKSENFTKRFGVPLTVVIERDQTEIPKLIQNSIKIIEKLGLQETGIFRLSGQKGDIDRYKEEFDSGKDVTFENEMNVHNVSGILKQWFRELPESLLTKELYPKFVQIQSNYQGKQLVEQEKLLVDQLPKLNKRIFEIISELMHKIKKYEKVNKMGIQNLALLFGPTLCSLRGEKANNVINMSIECQIVSIMSNNHDYMFGKSEYGVNLIDQDEDNNYDDDDENYTKELSKAIAIDNNIQIDPENVDEQIFFKVGDIISVTNTDDEEWWYGKIICREDGNKENIEQFGYFPASTVEKIGEDEYLTLINQEK
ncbi:rho/rac/cdc gtpase-activating protein [Anaeramoeba flamelloides]|uniref:Rho/rac/cdc gtpase-activating protein n=1 Tax=Anaeramoeba flamelloides TaxID=1746091 RepID=A0AAV8A3P5_9EUKA|nr:rho/rac/cdc gtpase-activating protein [Anaeramoeba flamelloides]